MAGDGMRDRRAHLASRARARTFRHLGFMNRLSVLFLLLFLLIVVFHLGLSASEAHIALVDTILAKILLARYAFN
jgi:hypothetical protein